MGSGGLEIGKRVAEQLGLKFYDKELLAEAARESGICPECFDRIDEKVKTVYGGVGVFGMRFPFLSDPNGVQMSAISPDNLFLIQSDTMCRIASESPALFVGRCANYVLRGRKDLFSVFISADEPDRIDRITSRTGCSEEEAKAAIKKSDKERTAYYDYFANRTWNAATSYDLCINSSRLGIDGAANLIVSCVKALNL